MLGLRVRKLGQREEVSVARTEHPIVSDHTSDILVLYIGAAMNVTGEGVVLGINLL